MAEQSTVGVLKSKVDEMTRKDIREGELTQRVEEQTGKVPSLAFFGLAIGSMALSAALAASSDRKEYANFVGLWAPTFLLIGIYNKIVKLQAR
jgi:hypothetical protein